MQVEYEEEGINWTSIEFPDNADMLELVEGRAGIISILNEECIRPGGNDEGFTSKLTKAHKGHKRYVTEKLSKTAFTLKHYAGPVKYTTVAFVDKNKDTLSEDLVDAVANSKSTFVQGVFAKTALPKDASAAGPPVGSDKPRRRKRSTLGGETVTSKFKAQLGLLMDNISKTEVQYVRCIKPNRIKSSTAMNNIMVVEQLRCAGVIEAIRISRAGYPNRLLHGEFVQRFKLLAPAALVLGKAASEAASLEVGAGAASGPTDVAAELAVGQCTTLLSTLLADQETDYQMGITKVYFKTGILELLEEKRGVELATHAIIIQRFIRGMLAYCRYHRFRARVLQLQSHFRCWVDFTANHELTPKCVAFAAVASG